MELLTTILGEGLAVVLVPLVIVLCAVALLALQLLLSLVMYWLRRFGEQAPGGRATRVQITYRRLRRWVITTLLLCGVGALLAETVLFESSLRAIFAVVKARQQIAIRFKSASGSWFRGTLRFKEIRVERSGHPTLDVSLTLRELRLSAPLLTALRKPAQIGSIELIGARGSLTRRGKRAKARAKRPFVIRSLLMRDCRFLLRDQTRGRQFELPVNVTRLSGAPLRSDQLLRDLFFGAEIAGRIAEAPFEVATSKDAARTRWRVRDLKLAAVRPALRGVRQLSLVKTATISAELVSRPSRLKPNLRELDVDLELSQVKLQTARLKGVPSAVIFGVVLAFNLKPRRLRVKFRLTLDPRQLLHGERFDLPGFKAALAGALIQKLLGR